MTSITGQVVRVKGGPWEGFQGTVSAQDGRFLHITGDEASQAKWKQKGILLHEGQVEVLEEDRKGPAVPLDVPSVPPPPVPNPRGEERRGVAGPEDFRGSDEESHLMTQTSAAKLRAVEEADRKAWEGPGVEVVAKLRDPRITPGEWAKEVLDGQLQFPGEEFSPSPRKDRDPSKATRARWDLMPALAEEEVVAVLTQSTQVYPPDNWREIPEAEFYPLMYAAARRHMSAHRRGVNVDPDSGRHPLAHAALCLLFILERELETDQAVTYTLTAKGTKALEAAEAAEAATQDPRVFPGLLDKLEARVGRLEKILAKD